jgi:hypothetical protein
MSFFQLRRQNRRRHLKNGFEAARGPTSLSTSQFFTAGERFINADLKKEILRALLITGRQQSGRQQSGRQQSGRHI